MAAALRCWIIGLGLLGLFGWHYLPYMPGPLGEMGDDYSVVLTNLLSGYFWYLQNGIWALPWFSPGECGGVPFFADASATWFSLQQALTVVVPPVTAVRMTFLAFAFAGYLGTYHLLRRAFLASEWSALLAATLFMFNGFYGVRMLVGHVGFLPFMLLPWFCLAMLAPGRHWSLPIAGGGMVLAAMLQGGMMQLVPAVLLAAGMILCIHAARSGLSVRPVLIATASVLLGLALAAGKLATLGMFLANFPRNDLRLPGFANLFNELGNLLGALFWAVPGNPEADMVNVQVELSPYEFEIGVTPIPLLLMLGAALRWRPRPEQASFLLAATLLASIPVAVNWYTPDWNAFLKALPLFRSASNLLRWNASYMLPAIILGALALERIPFPPAWLSGAAIAGTIAMALLHGAAVPDFHYNSRAVTRAWFAAHRSGKPIPITAIWAESKFSVTHPYGHINFNNAMTVGASNLQCYQPMFGYRNEHLPMAGIFPGPVTATWEGTLNLRNPACFLFPRENACLPGSNFSVEDQQSANAFANWQPFPFNKPAWLDWLVLANQWIFWIVLATIIQAVWRHTIGARKMTDP